MKLPLETRGFAPSTSSASVLAMSGIGWIDDEPNTASLPANLLAQSCVPDEKSRVMPSWAKNEPLAGPARVLNASGCRRTRRPPAGRDARSRRSAWSDTGDRVVPRHLLPAIVDPTLRMVQAIGVAMDLERRDPLRAGEALAHGMLVVGAHRTIWPSSTVATSPHAGSHTRQNVLTSGRTSNASLITQVLHHHGPVLRHRGTRCEIRRAVTAGPSRASSARAVQPMTVPPRSTSTRSNGRSRYCG